MTIILVVLALGSSVALLAKDAGMGTLPRLPLHVLSGVALLLVGGAFLLVQPMMCLRPKEILKNALLAATFILWGTVQFMAQNVLSMRLGNFVVALFVLDLAWATLVAVNPPEQRAHVSRLGRANCRESEIVLGKGLTPPED